MPIRILLQLASRPFRIALRFEYRGQSQSRIRIFRVRCQRASNRRLGKLQVAAAKVYARQAGVS
jgi:hypothetical protein